jgi:hypothetical protein
MFVRFLRLGRHGWFNGFPKLSTIPGLLFAGGSIQDSIKAPNGGRDLSLIRNRLAQDSGNHSQAPARATFLFDGSPLQ